MHYKQLLAVGPEILHFDLLFPKITRSIFWEPERFYIQNGAKKKNGDTETYKALPRKDIFRTFSVVRRNTTKQSLEEPSPTTYTTHSHFHNERAFSSIHYSTLR